jgi:hypothetical protein
MCQYKALKKNRQMCRYKALKNKMKKAKGGVGRTSLTILLMLED